MAIPISWPSSDEVEDSYLSLDMLLEQLLITLRQVLMHRRRELALASERQRASTSDNQCAAENSNNLCSLVSEQQSSNEQSNNQQTEVVDVQHPRLPVPDIIRHIYHHQQPDILQDLTDCEILRQRRKLLRRQSLTRPPVNTWIQVGAELRRIADLIRNSEHQNYGKVPTRLKKPTNTTPAVLSLIRSNLSTPLWTTLALIVGWHLLAKTR